MPVRANKAFISRASLNWYRGWKVHMFQIGFPMPGLASDGIPVGEGATLLWPAS